MQTTSRQCRKRPFSQLLLPAGSSIAGLVLGVLLTITASFVSAATSAITELNGVWLLVPDLSESLAKKEAELLPLKSRKEKQKFAGQESREHADGKQFHNKVKEYERRKRERHTSTRKLSVNATYEIRKMVTAERLKIYQSGKVIISYAGEINRRLNPSPHGRGYTASGKGHTKDLNGESLTYYDGDTLVVETRTRNNGRLIEKYHVDGDSGLLNVWFRVKSPSRKQIVEFTRVFERK